MGVVSGDAVGDESWHSDGLVVRVSGQIESFGESSIPINEQALTAVADLIQDVQPGAMVQKFVLLVETIDEEDRWISAFTAPGQKRWDSMGMLQYAMTMEQNVVLEVPSDPEDER